MKRLIHIIAMSAVLLSGTMIPVGCSSAAGDMDVPVTASQVSATLSLTVSQYADFRSEPDTKADFVAADESIHYAGESRIDDIALYVFDASSAWVKKGNVFVFDSTRAKQITAAPVIPMHTQTHGDVLRADFKLAKPYESLAIIVLANLGQGSYPSVGGVGASLATVAATLADNTGTSGAFTFDPSKEYGGSVGIPMSGWQVFGTKDKPLKFYKGMSTPLTRQGFSDADALKAYTDKGFVDDDDLLPLVRSLARIRFTYTGSRKFEILSAAIRNYRDTFGAAPDSLLNRSYYNPMDSIGDWGAAVKGDVAMRKLADNSWVAYVPEYCLTKTGVAGSDFEPYMVFKTKDAAGQTYLYEKDKITVNNGTDPEVVYDRPDGRLDWLQMITQTKKTAPDGTEIPKGTRFNLVRGYTYEWNATGVERW